MPAGICVEIGCPQPVTRHPFSTSTILHAMVMFNVKILLNYIPELLYALVFAAIGFPFVKLLNSKKLRLFIVLLTVLLALTLLSIIRSRAPLGVQLTIESPKQNAIFYSPPVVVQGTVFPPNARVRLLVHPEDTDSWWVQSSPEQNEAAGLWQGTCYIGTDSMGIGKRYDIVAVGSANSWFFDALLGRFLEPGTRVKTLPLISKSELVVVTRKE